MFDKLIDNFNKLTSNQVWKTYLINKFEKLINKFEKLINKFEKLINKFEKLINKFKNKPDEMILKYLI